MDSVNGIFEGSSSSLYHSWRSHVPIVKMWSCISEPEINANIWRTPPPSSFLYNIFELYLCISVRSETSEYLQLFWSNWPKITKMGNNSIWHYCINLGEDEIFIFFFNFFFIDNIFKGNKLDKAKAGEWETFYFWFKLSVGLGLKRAQALDSWRVQCDS